MLLVLTLIQYIRISIMLVLRLWSGRDSIGIVVRVRIRG